MVTRAAAPSPGGAAAVKDNWNQYLDGDRDKAPGDYIVAWLKDAANAAANATKNKMNEIASRIDQFDQGRRLLAEGENSDAYQAIYAKTAGCKAVEADRALQQSIENLARINMEEASFSTQQPMKQKVCWSVGQTYGRAAGHLGDFVPDCPTWRTDVERDAGVIMNIQMMKGFGGIAGGVLQRTVSAASEAIGGGAKPSQPSSGASGGSRGEASSQPSIEDLMQELFKLHDLNGNGVLEEQELVQLNKKIAMLHHGKEIDKKQVEQKFKGVFRARLDNRGQPVPYEVFRAYMMEVLDDLDKDPRAKVMILEQWIAEAESAREVFAFMSFASFSDEPFLENLGIDRSPAAAAAQAMASTPVPPTASPDAVKRPEELPTWGSGASAGSGGASQGSGYGHAAATSSSPAASMLSPVEIENAYARGKELWCDQRFKEALVVFQQIFAVDPHYHNTSEYVKKCKEQIGLEATQANLEHSYENGKALYCKERFKEALELFRQINAEHPEYRNTAKYVEVCQEKISMSGNSVEVAELVYKKGDKVQVWSNSKKIWTDAVVTEAFDKPTFTEGYAVPAGSYKVSSKAGTKWIMPEHVSSQLRQCA